MPAEYSQYWNCCKPPVKGYAGVAIFTKIKPLNIIYGIGELDCEGRVITLEFKKFFLVTVYSPNSSTGLKRIEYRINTWDKKFFQFIQDLETNGKPVILGGDLNVCHTENDICDPERWRNTP